MCIYSVVNVFIIITIILVTNANASLSTFCLCLCSVKPYVRIVHVLYTRIWLVCHVSIKVIFNLAEATNLCVFVYK